MRANRGRGLIGGKSTLAENYDIELVGALTRSLEITEDPRREIRPSPFALLSARTRVSLNRLYIYIYTYTESSLPLSPVEHHRRKKVGRVDNGEE